VVVFNFKVNIVMKYKDHIDPEEFLAIESQKSISSSPAGSYGQIKLYTGLKMPLDLAPLLPIFQIEFGQTASLPFVLNADICGFSRSDYLLLTDCTCCNKVIYKALLEQSLSVVQVNGILNNFSVLTEFSVSSCDVHSNQLEQLAVACPNLQRLNLEHNKRCLKGLQGLRTIAVPVTT